MEPFSGTPGGVACRGGHTQLAAVRATRGLRRIPLQLAQTCSPAAVSMMVDAYRLLTSTFPAAGPPLNLSAMAGSQPSGSTVESSSCGELVVGAVGRGATAPLPASSRTAGTSVLFCLHPPAPDTPAAQRKIVLIRASERRTSASIANKGHSEKVLYSHHVEPGACALATPPMGRGAPKGDAGWLTPPHAWLPRAPREHHREAPEQRGQREGSPPAPPPKGSDPRAAARAKCGEWSAGGGTAAR
jgi:hypothetical protein